MKETGIIISGDPPRLILRKAIEADLEPVIKLIDSEFTKEGFGFVNKAQIQTEVLKHRVFVAEENGKIIGCRIGLGIVWNMVVAKASRGKGVGEALIEQLRPHTIRVKNKPIGHLSKKQRDEFIDPTGFYERLGYIFWGNSYPKNFWQKAGEKAQFHSIGDKAHIAVFRDVQCVLFT